MNKTGGSEILNQTRNADGEIVTLYAVAATVWNRNIREWVSDICYMHAKDAANARFLYTAQMHGKRFTIVGIAPAIGFKVLDEHGEKLMA